MNFQTFRLSPLIVVALLLVGCGDTTKTAPIADTSPASAEDEGAHEGHDHSEGPHGGHVVVLGDHSAHLEMVHGEGGALVVYALDADMNAARLDEAPTLNLITDDGSVAVKGTEVANDGWQLEHTALLDDDVRGRFRLKIGGKSYASDFEPGHHGHDHGDSAHGPHDGTVVTFGGAQSKLGGTLELKLHDDKGDLELWLALDESFDLPFDAPVDTMVKVVFQDHENREVLLAVRNTEQNEDEDGAPNLRAGKTNYFIFPGTTGADATWLQGAGFESKVVVSFVVDGITYKSDAFDLRPHTH